MHSTLTSLNTRNWIQFIYLFLLESFCPALNGNIYLQACKEPDISHGKSCHLNFTYCSNDEMVGPKSLKCLDNGTWSEGGTYCESKKYLISKRL